MTFKEVPKYNKKCKYCNDSFISYRKTAKFDTSKCRRLWHRENNPKYLASERKRTQKYRKKKRKLLLLRRKELLLEKYRKFLTSKKGPLFKENPFLKLIKQD